MSEFHLDVRTGICVFVASSFVNNAVDTVMNAIFPSFFVARLFFDILLALFFSYLAATCNAQAQRNPKVHCNYDVETPNFRDTLQRDILIHNDLRKRN